MVPRPCPRPLSAPEARALCGGTRWAGARSMRPPTMSGHFLLAPIPESSSDYLLPKDIRLAVLGAGRVGKSGECLGPSRGGRPRARPGQLGAPVREWGLVRQVGYNSRTRHKPRGGHDGRALGFAEPWDAGSTSGSAAHHSRHFLGSVPA